MTDCTIIVNTCDAYEDVWELFFCALNEFWPKCKYKIVLNTESKKYSSNNENIRTHTATPLPKNDLWGKRLRSTLNSIDTEYVIMLFDDFILESDFNQKKLDQCLQRMEEDRSISVFYFSQVGNTNFDDKKYEDFEKVGTKADYRLNSAPALWRRSNLLEFTGENDNPWAWEIFGSYRTYDPKYSFYCAKEDKEDIFQYNYERGGAIYRGKWVTDVVLPKLKKYNITLDINTRGTTNFLTIEKRTFLWKVNFFIIGYKMIGIGVLLFLYRIILNKVKAYFK